MSARAPAFGDDARWRWIAFTPALAIMLVLSVLPVVNLVVMSFFKITWADARSSWVAVGLANYAALGEDPLYRASLRNTVFFAGVSVMVQMLLGFALALLCSKALRARSLYRMIFILPILIPGIVVGAIWKLILNEDFGLLNQVLALVGMWPIDWLGEPSIALLSVVLVDVWHWTPFCFLLLLASLESLPQDIYESAKIDGARGWQEIAWITLPLMLPAILVTFAFRLIVAFKVFDEVYLLTSGGPGTATEVLSFTIYQRFFAEDRAGYGAAMSVSAIFIVCLLLALALTARRRVGSAT